MEVEEQNPLRVEPEIKSAPRTRQIYWCDFPQDARKPEFWKRRPVLIISRTSKLYGHFTGLPITTVEQAENKWAYQIVSPLDQCDAWVICNHIISLSCSRLRPSRTVIPRLNANDFNEIINLALSALPHPQA